VDQKLAVELYKVHVGGQSEWLGLHQKHCQQFLVLISAVSAASLTALHYFGGDPVVLCAICMGPALNVILAITAIKLCSRAYKRFLEDVTIAAKLQPLLGLSKREADGNHGEDTQVFGDDVAYTPSRWHRARADHGTADEFVRAYGNRGAHLYVTVTFGALIIANVVLLVVVAFAAAAAALREVQRMFVV